MTALDDAARAVAEARRDVHEWLYRLVASTAARAAVARLEAAVRAHDAEVVRAMDPIEIVLAGVHATSDIARVLDPTTRPEEVEGPPGLTKS